MNVSESVGEGDCEGVGKAKGEGMGVGYGCLDVVFFLFFRMSECLFI